jgi:hypothetical protein
MAHGQVSEMIPASSEAVFDLLHDYNRRLEWDTLLQAAYLTDGHTQAAKGVTSVCVGRKSLGSIPLATIYVSFNRPTVAAVKMVNTPPLFQTWAASIHHKDLAQGHSQMTYKFHFTVKPASLQFILDPLMKQIFTWETKKRLQALKIFFSQSLGGFQNL